jgi:hypothetical protein
LAIIKQRGASHGLAETASAITQGADGTYRVADPAARQAILDLRNDPDVAGRMAGELAFANARTLSASLGRSVSSGELYVAHFLGAGNAATLIGEADRNPKADAAGLFPAQAAANRAIFYQGGQPRSVREVLDVLLAGFDPEAELSAPRPAEPSAAPLVAAWAETRRTEPMPAGSHDAAETAANAFAAARARIDALFGNAASVAAAPSGLWRGFASAPALFEVAMEADALTPLPVLDSPEEATRPRQGIRAAIGPLDPDRFLRSG